MKPAFRHLQGYAFDPSLSLDMDTVEVNRITYKIRWEEGPNEIDSGTLNYNHGPIPQGEYLEVIDFDPTTKTTYQPVNLNDPYILATDGLSPSESNPQFHQQMVYAVAMQTIQNFENALGRKIHWATRLLSNRKYEEYVPRLRIYPHALREANAFYSPQKKALLFGYFAATPANVTTQMPGSLVFTCLSHDIIAHETTHAILDGIHRNYNRPTNPDVLAFHEAFADIVALFQHFSFPEVLRHQIAKTRGDLEKQNLLGELAQQFGSAIGHYGSLRNALGKIDPETQQWIPAKPDPAEYINTTQPHARGSILVGAVFDAFLSVYKRRIRDLLRIATRGTGILPEGDLHPDLVNRLSIEAAKTAKHILRMCIRALDYCPPMDINFGDYLRAIITADFDIVKEDSCYYRLAFIDAFRKRGIYPEGIKTLSEESLRYPNQSDKLGPESSAIVTALSKFLEDYRKQMVRITSREEIYDLTRDFVGGQRGFKGFHAMLSESFDAQDCDVASEEFGRLTGLVLNYWEDYGIRTSTRTKGPSFQVKDLHLVSRSGPGGSQVNQIVFGLIQRMGAVVKEDGNVEFYEPPANNRKTQKSPPQGGIEVQGGCTLIFDLDNLKLKYAISKPLLDFSQKHTENGCQYFEVNKQRILAQNEYEQSELNLGMSEVGHYFGSGKSNLLGEPFALLHTKGSHHE